MLIVRSSNDKESHVNHVEHEHEDLYRRGSLNLFNRSCQSKAAAALGCRKDVSHLDKVRWLEDVLVHQE